MGRGAEFVVCASGHSTRRSFKPPVSVSACAPAWDWMEASLVEAGGGMRGVGRGDAVFLGG